MIRTLLTGIIAFSTITAAYADLTALEAKAAASPENARVLYDLTRAYCKHDSADKAVESWRRLVDIDYDLASEVFLRANIAAYLGIEPFFPEMICDTMAAHPRFGPNREWIVFQAVIGGQMRVGMMDFFGDHYQVLTSRDYYCHEPAFVDSKDRILYTRYADDDVVELVYRDLQRNETRAILDSKTLTQPQSPDMPKSNLPMLFSFLSPETRTTEIGQYNIKKSKMKRLTDNYYSDRTPRYSSNGRLITFVSDNRTNLDIYIMNRRGKRKRQITDWRCHEVNPDFGDNDSKIAFSSNKRDHFDIYICELKSGDIYPVTLNEGNDMRPDISKDGNWLIFDSNRDTDILKSYLVPLNQPVSVEQLVEEIDNQ
ncbi:hypothetical protein GF359_00435 [candidate division WOR-3 bacterium]|uniref:Tetratricopeptide repeat protein n=1 Tax=candidate division WOR-3 bacterium TaxID=2052148 RepID=A0A9D5QD30_UNCW3|nr:hypothetical protein [candidate division WOR-3 bacterium]MBD3363660.1 hypothetical protein [candidate division WOR-3 bacterium]